jgi:hypothetical protein
VFPHFNFIFPGVADQVLTIHNHPKMACTEISSRYPHMATTGCCNCCRCMCCM